MRVGGDRAIQVTARIVAATNRNLEREVEAGRFRQDLFYRLNVHTLRVPPLRDRLSDIPALVAHLLRAIATHIGVRPKPIDPEAVALLAAYDWRRNNVRELRNCLERMMIASDAPSIEAADVPPEIRGDARSAKRGEQRGEDRGEERDEAPDAAGASTAGTLTALKAQAERQIVLDALDKHDWQITRTAEALGLSDHSSLLKIMRRLGLNKDARRDA
jgi:two-component system nitrogen regulation response regulator NtrX